MGLYCTIIFLLDMYAYNQFFLKNKWVDYHKYSNRFRPLRKLSVDSFTNCLRDRKFAS